MNDVGVFRWLVVSAMTCTLWVSSALARAEGWDMEPRDPPGYELVMQLVVTCTEPETMGGSSDKSKDGIRDEIWPIVGGKFVGKGIRGTVVPGGGDFPVVRPDGVVVVDALYRLKTDDGVTIIIHNKGLAYESQPEVEKYRLVPEFIAPQGKYDWLNKHVFVSTLVWPVPESMKVTHKLNENDRLIEVYKVL
ncbi:DUF3237 family protein [Aestuariicella hydrocarbonica]|uniref:DUF3237 family protein n=1 Tax=Pseudomaricurvus hydrocarbonicus TaxID=1470433 RepID=A0A9E5JZY4_9GAMM|nr:DUF3237 family protein [Aestuariicella hydrocarbonica]NHO65852.1 DUF3237 family protein [Aestuariicella hydrocarbonica]